MKLLLDTHAFLWFIDGNSSLTQKARQAIENENNQRFLSIAIAEGRRQRAEGRRKTLTIIKF